jgi:uncharacterized protein (DUF486 family)
MEFGVEFDMGHSLQVLMPANKTGLQVMKQNATAKYNSLIVLLVFLLFSCLFM